MVITFQFEASADIVMFSDVAKQMMGILGKEPAARGIVPVDELPAAIARLRAAAEPIVSIAQRALSRLDCSSIR